MNGSSTLEKALVDVNGDGKLDAVLGEDLVHGGPGGLYWYEAPSSGNLRDAWIRHTIASRGGFYEAMAISDINGDGAPDIIASIDNKLVWFENPSGHKTISQGTGGHDFIHQNLLRSFRGSPATDHWPMHVIRGSGGVHEIVLGDIDGDGKTDIICSGGRWRRVPSCFRTPRNSWTEVRFWTAGEGVALLDIGAGMGSINIASGDGNDIVWYENPRESGGDARRGRGFDTSQPPLRAPTTTASAAESFLQRPHGSDRRQQRGQTMICPASTASSRRRTAGALGPYRRSIPHIRRCIRLAWLT